MKRSRIAPFAGGVAALVLWIMREPILSMFPMLWQGRIEGGDAIDVLNPVAIGGYGLVAISVGLMVAWILLNSTDDKGIFWLLCMPILSGMTVLALGRVGKWSEPLLTTAAVVVSYIVLGVGMHRVPGWCSRKGDRLVLAWPAIMKQPASPNGGSGFLNTGRLHSSREVATHLINAFEASMADLATEEIKIRPILYMDGIRIIRLKDSAEEAELNGFRSHAYRVSRGFDEFIFVLHCKIAKAGLTYRLDAKTRSRNFLPLLFLLGLIGLMTGFLFGILVALIAPLCYLAMAAQLTGFGEWIFQGQRGEGRRRERLEEYLPVFRYALAEAILGSQFSVFDPFDSLTEQKPDLNAPEFERRGVENATSPSGSTQLKEQPERHSGATRARRD